MASNQARQRQPGVVLRLWVAAALVMAVASLALATSLGRQETPRGGMQPLARVALEHTIIESASSSDRRGDHVAVLTVDNTLHVLTFGPAGVADQRLPLPWPPPEFGRAWFLFTDINSDGLLDLCAVRNRRTLSSHSDIPYVKPEWVVFLQTEGGFQTAQVGTGLNPAGFGERTNQMIAHGRALGLQPVDVGGAVGLVTRVRRIDNGRVMHLLQGEPCRVADFDGDGHDDVLTMEIPSHSQEWLRYRLYLWRDSGPMLVWDESYRQVIPNSARPQHHIADLADVDQDGLMELVICEPRYGLVHILGLSPALLER